MYMKIQKQIMKSLVLGSKVWQKTVVTAFLFHIYM